MKKCHSVETILRSFDSGGRVVSGVSIPRPHGISSSYRAEFVDFGAPPSNHLWWSKSTVYSYSLHS